LGNIETAVKKIEKDIKKDLPSKAMEGKPEKITKPEKLEKPEKVEKIENLKK